MSKTICLISIFVLLLCFTSLPYGDSISDWRQDIQVGDILYDPTGWVLGDFFPEVNLPIIDPIPTGHIAIYVGDINYGDLIFPNQIVEASLIGGGVYNLSIETWDYPLTEKAWIFRVRTDSTTKKKAVNFVLDQIGKPYSIYYYDANANINNNSWYCSELIWAAYLNAGVDLVDFGHQEGLIINVPVSPSDIASDNDIDAIGYHSILSPVPPDAYRVRNLTLQRSYFRINEALSDPDLNTDHELVLAPGGYLENIEINIPGLKIRAKSYDSKNKLCLTVIRSHQTHPFIKELLDKAESLIGLQASKRPTVITVKSSDVTLEGLTLTGAWGDDKYSGLLIDQGSDRCHIQNCLIFNNPVGLAVYDSDYQVISYNWLGYNSYALGLIKSYGSTITRNTFYQSFEYGLIVSQDDSACASEVVSESLSITDGQKLLTTLRQARDHLLPSQLNKLYYHFNPELRKIISSDLFLQISLANFLLSLEPFITNPDLPLSDKTLSVADDLIDQFSVMPNISSDLSSFLENIDKYLSYLYHPTFRQIISKFPINNNDMFYPTSPEFTPDPNKFYLNSFVDNTRDIKSDYDDELLIFHSNKVLSYQYNGNSFSFPLGNFWPGNYSGTDSDGNGVGDEAFGLDLYPLIDSPEQYLLADEEVSISGWSLY